MNWTECASNTNTVGNQGDVIVWGDLVFRSWNSGTPAPQVGGVNIPVTDPARYTTPGAFCGDWPMFREPADPATGLPERGQEGVHIIDISDPENPDVIGFVDTPCGSHTETLVPDLENNRLLIYSNSSANTTFGCLVVESSDAVRRHRHHRGPAGRSGGRLVPALRAGRGPDGGPSTHSCHDTA